MKRREFLEGTASAALLLVGYSGATLPVWAAESDLEKASAELVALLRKTEPRIHEQMLHRCAEAAHAARSYTTSPVFQVSGIILTEEEIHSAYRMSGC